MDFKDKCVWIIGASSGIGEALAKELAKRGAKVAVSSRRAELLDGIVRQIGASGGNAKAFPVDITDLAALKIAAQQVEEWGGPLDVAIPNAGTHRFTKPEAFDSADYMDLMKLNFGGMLNTIEVVLPGMLGRKAGRIAPVASLAGSRGLPRAAAYGASKAAMNNFLESIRFHVRRSNVGITVINPGFVKTPLTDKNDFYMPFLVDADKAAKIIADGLEREKNVISFPIPFNWIVGFGRILPYPIYEWIVDKLW